MKWFRPRFSVRVLLIVLTLICAYLACWKPTKERGVRDAMNMVNGPPGWIDGEFVQKFSQSGYIAYGGSSPIPLVVK